MEKPTPEQAIKILDDATQPGVKLNRMDFVIVQMALEVLAEVVQQAGQRIPTDVERINGYKTGQRIQAIQTIANGSTDKETTEKKL